MGPIVPGKIWGLGRCRRENAAGKGNLRLRALP